MSLMLFLAVMVSGNLEATLAASSAFSLPTSPMWLGTQTREIFGKCLVTRFLTEVAYCEWLWWLVIEEMEEKESVHITCLSEGDCVGVVFVGRKVLNYA